MESRQYISNEQLDASRPRTATPQSLSLVIAEKQTEWRSWVRRSRTAPFVLAQKSQESTAEFSLRVRSELDRLQKMGVLVAHVAFFPGEAADEESVTARFSTGVALGTHLASSGGGVLLLRSAASHRSLGNLAAAIRYTVEGSSVFVICTEGSAELNVPQ